MIILTQHQVSSYQAGRRKCLLTPASPPSQCVAFTTQVSEERVARYISAYRVKRRKLRQISQLNE